MSICKACCTIVDGMTAQEGEVERSEMRTAVAALLAAVLSLLLIGFVGRWLWNGSVCKMFTFCKKVDGMLPIIGLYVFIRLLFPTCC